MYFKIVVFISLACCVYGEEVLDLPEGSKCSVDGVDGVCAGVYNCVDATEDIKNKRYPPICTYRGEIPIVCCTNCKLVNDTRKMFVSPTSGKLYFRNGQKARDKCLDYIQELEPCHGDHRGIIYKQKEMNKNCYNFYSGTEGLRWFGAGGSNANRDQFPHMAFLGYGDDEDSAQWLCGGTLISENFILTAAHCKSSPVLGEVRYIALGILKRTDPRELWQKYNVKRIISHPQYRSPSKYHDIALLETQGRVSFNIHVMPACLHFEMEWFDKAAEATGWGALGFRREVADTLQTIPLEEFSKEECAQLYPRHRHLKSGYHHESQMCYGSHITVRDTCEGDSGGPLQNRGHITWCQYTVIGVTSTGRQCGLIGSTGLYTRVINYVHWIEDIVWPDV